MKEKIISQYPYRIELHSHTYPGSGCSTLTPAEMVRIYAEKGYHGVVITNHLEPDKLLFEKKKRLLCIPGIMKLQRLQQSIMV